jgi:8-oxo-dGTP pyrophosphatase MutT (NUDIX family)
MRLYARFGWAIAPLLALAFVAYNRIIVSPRARVIVMNSRGQVLLVRSWARAREWELPGGGIRRSELPVAAARRELYEEAGVTLAIDELVPLGKVRFGYDAYVFSAKIKDGVRLKGTSWEVLELGWYSLDTLPDNTSPFISWALKNLQK